MGLPGGAVATRGGGPPHLSGASAGASSPSRCRAPTRRSAPGRCSGSCASTPTPTTSRSTRTRPATTTCASSPCSTSSSTPPTARAATCLLGDDGGIWAIDNGLSFHAEFKLRTVIWEFGGDILRADEVEPVERLVTDGLPDEIAVLLDPFERDALLTRRGRS